MSGRAQEPSGHRRLAGSRSRACACALLCLLTAACAGGASIEQLAADTTLTTSSIEAAPSPKVPAKDELSDAATIRNAVSVADVETLGASPMPWVNPLTGSRGTIVEISDSRVGSRLCRDFTATRESYDGVSLVRGEACMDVDGTWSMRAFSPVG